MVWLYESQQRQCNRLQLMNATIVVLTLQPILKLPLLWNVKYLEISIPIILQIV